MKYIRMEFENIEPLRIADDSVSQSGQTDTLTYVPGSSIRGLLISELIRSGKNTQEEINRLMSDQVRFLNAYPVSEKAELLPSWKGFYEDKTGEDQKPVQSVLINGDVEPGYKRSSVGMYGYPEGGCFYHTNIERNSDLKINIGKRDGDKRNVFRNRYMAPGYRFAAYIGLKDANASMTDEILKLLTTLQKNGRFILGNARSAGLGKCVLKGFGTYDGIPYEYYAADEDARGYVYMLLLSDLAMRSDDGENIGLNMDALRRITGLDDLELLFCSTSLVDIRGYNRQWHTKIPSVKMYQKGSIFKLGFSGTFPAEKMKVLEDEGLGIRKNEGFGRILFLKDYESIRYRKKMDGDIRRASGGEVLLSDEDRQVLKIAERGIYQRLIERNQEKKLGKSAEWRRTVKNSQLGQVRAILSRYRFSPEDAIEELQKFTAHQQEKADSQKYHRDTGDRNTLNSSLQLISGNSLTETLTLDKVQIDGFRPEGLFSEEELAKMKIDFLIRRIDMENREGKADD